METALQLPKSIDPFSASVISGMQTRDENADIEKAKLEQSKASQVAPFQEKLTQDRTKYGEESKQYQKVGEEVYKEGEQNAQWAKDNVPKPLNVPDFKREPLDTKEMNSLGAVMMAFALIGGRHNMNPMVTAGNALASAVKGYKDGDDAKFEKDYKTYKLNFDKAVKIHEDEVNQYKDILNAQNMSLSAKARRLELIATGHGDTKAQMEFASQDMTRITKEIDEKEKQLDVVTEKRNNVDKSVMQAVETNLARRDAEKDRLFMHQESLDAKLNPLGGAKGTTPEGIRAETYAYLINNVTPPKRTGEYSAVMSDIAKLAKESNMTTEQLISAGADVKTQVMAKRTFEVRTQNLLRAENQLELEIPVMKKAMDDLAPSNTPAAAKLDMWAIRQGGGTKKEMELVTQLDQAASAVFNEYEGIITGNPGTLNVSDVTAAKDAYANAKTPIQMHAAIDGMKRIIKNAKQANNETRTQIMGNIRSSIDGNKSSDSEVKTFSTEEEAQKAGLPDGTPIIVNGVKGKWHN